MFSSRKGARAMVLGTVIVVASGIGLTSCSKDDAATTDVSKTEAASAAVATDTAEDLASQASAAATEAVGSEAMASQAASTDAMAGSDAAGGAALKATLIGEMLKGMNAGAAADPADIDCVSSKVTEKDVSALMSGAAAGGGLPPEGLPVMKAIFGCKPKPLMDSFVKSSFDDMPAEVTDDQKTCMANKFFDFISTDEETLAAMVGDSSKPPAKFKAEGAKIVKDCVPAGAAQDKLIAEISKDS